MNTSLPQVTIIIPVRNEAVAIQDTLNAVFVQDYPAELTEILVIDGESDDNTPNIINSLTLDHPNLHLLKNPKRITPAALNAGIRQSNGKYIIRVDAHTIIEGIKHSADEPERSTQASQGRVLRLGEVVATVVAMVKLASFTALHRIGSVAVKVL